MTPNSEDKKAIRKRDQNRIRLTGTCSRCGATDVDTSRHHLWYSQEFDPNAVIEVCDECDDKIHGREDAESLGRSINAIQNLTIDKDEIVRLGGVKIGIEYVDKNGTISINMAKR
jgi:5-methylcytosine-specific restriction endonuclease McrA